jgi:glutamyl-tRNA synthetase
MGSVRTALFNWLYARHTGGKFLLRIEDTDRERSTQEYTDAIFEAMQWLGMQQDEPVVVQSERVAHHVAAAQSLVDQGKAYRCFCSPEAIQAMRDRAMQEKGRVMYDGTCRDANHAHDETRPYVIRFRMREGGATTIEDQVLGPITIDDREFDDFIIVRSDGTPTYNFVVVCDDADMQVTHVIRGQDHVNNTFKQHHLYDALGLAVPAFAHLPLIDGLSKRKGSTSVQAYRDRGYLQEAVINYIARLGWSHGDEEIFSPSDLIAKFDLSGVNRASGTYDETKMAWVNAQWMKRLSVSELAERALPFVQAQHPAAVMDDRFLGLTALLQPRAADLVAFAEAAAFVYVTPTEYDEKACSKWMKAGSRAPFVDLLDAFEGLSTFDVVHIEQAFEAVIARHEIGMGKLAQPVRIALTGTAMSPSIYETVELVGQAAVVARMQAALHLLPDPA